MMCNIVPPTTYGGGIAGKALPYWSSSEDLSSFSIMGSTLSQLESQPSAESQPRDAWKPIPLCGTLPTLVVPAERYVEQLWAMLDQTLRYSKCGIGSDTLVGKGGTLDLDTLTIVGPVAPYKPVKLAPGVPPPPEYLPEMKDEQIALNTIKSLPTSPQSYSPRLGLPFFQIYGFHNTFPG